MKTVYLIDECQHQFPFTMRNIEVFLYFQKHRHLGHDIYLITQDADLLAKALRALAEYHIEAVRRSYSFAGEFRYRFVDPTTKEPWKTKVLKRDRRVFAFYRSMETTETEPMPSAPRRQFLSVAAIFLGAVIGFGYLLTGGRIFGVERKKEATAATAPKKAEPKKETTAATRPVPSADTPKKNPPVEARIQQPLFTGLGRLSGISQFGETKIFLVDLENSIARLTEDQLTTICRCHPQLLIPGTTFPVDLADSNHHRIISTPKDKNNQPPGPEALGGGRAG